MPLSDVDDFWGWSRQMRAKPLPSRSRRVDWNPADLAFGPQRVALEDESRWQAWPCGRRAGKTQAAEWWLLRGALSVPRSQWFYVSTTIKRAARTVFDELAQLARTLGGKPNYSTFRVSFGNGSKVHVTGVEHKRMADDLRGMPRVGGYVLDELQDWDDELLRYFYDSVVFPSLADLRGRVLVSGTGGAPRGFWHEATQEGSSWSVHRWTPFDNPHLAEGEAQALVEKAKRDRGCDESDPSIQREFYARFVADLTRQIFAVRRPDNVWAELPELSCYALGVDVGTVDATAVVTWGWHPQRRGLYLVRHESLKGLTSSGQMALVRTAYEWARQRGQVYGLACDPGGGGAPLVLELSQRFGLPITGAQKRDKAAAAVLLRNDLRNGSIKVPDDAGLIRAFETPEWDPDNVGSAVSAKVHWPDVVDAALYGYREAYEYLSREPAPPPTPAEKELASLHRLIDETTPESW